MDYRHIVIVLLVLFSLALFGCSEPAGSQGPAGTEDDPMLVYNAQDLDNVRNNLNLHFRQMADIDLVAIENWAPIGTASDPFRGTYDGNGYRISNMNITIPAEDLSDPVGVFGSVDHNNTFPFSDAKLLRVTLEGASISQEIARVVADPYQGDIGLLAGKVNNTSIEDCTVLQGTINVPNHMRVGGMIGEVGQNSPISRSSAQELSITAHSYIGGITGLLHGQEITESFATGTIASTETRTSSGYGAHVGGIVGQVSYHSSIIDCYFIGDISAEAGYVGGLAGRLYGAPSPSTTEVRNAYCMGTLDFPDISNYGGVIGEVQDFTGSNVIDLEGLVYLVVFPDGKASQTAYAAAGDLSGYGMQSITEADLTDQDELEGISWDFSDIWALDSSVNGGYPYLRNNPPPQGD